MRWLLAAVVDWTVIALCLAATMFGWWACIPAAFIIGTRQLALAVLGHDAAHGHAGRTGMSLCRLLCFWPLGVGIHGFKAHHWPHHAGVGAETDPEVPLRRAMEARRARIGVWRMVGLDFVGGGLPDLLRLLLLFRPQRLEDVVGPLVAQAMFIALAPLPMILTWYGAVGTSFLAAFRLRAFTEHEGTTTFRKDRPALCRRLWYLPHGTWMHWEHHEWPGVAVHGLALRRDW